MFLFFPHSVLCSISSEFWFRRMSAVFFLIAKIAHRLGPGDPKKNAFSRSPLPQRRKAWLAETRERAFSVMALLLWNDPLQGVPLGSFDGGRHTNVGVPALRNVMWVPALLTPHPMHAGLQGMTTEDTKIKWWQGTVVNVAMPRTSAHTSVLTMITRTQYTHTHIGGSANRCSG